MKYISTRDCGAKEVSAARAVIDGIADDGGLYVPTEFPKLDYRTLYGMDYAARAEKILGLFFDFDTAGIAREAYGDGFGDDPAPVVKIDDGRFMLELWHGRTHAFKDMALSVMSRILQAAKAAEHRTEHTLILVATSGDTGKAALEGFKNADGASVCVFYPTDGVSRVQKLAMQTQDGDNVTAVGITGNFDDAQRAVKAAFASEALKAELGKRNISLSSANSINIGRLVPQIAYYYSAYCDLAESGEIKGGELMDFVVPTGNFGNILAGWYAVKMGLPVNRLVCASNRNNVLCDFIETGEYDINREFYKTASPSMDILISGNLERLLFEASGRNAAVTAARMAELKATGRYRVSPEEQEKIYEWFAAGYADDDAAAQAIFDVFDEYGYLMDPHTATAYSVAQARGFVRPTAVVSTANPYKFAPFVLSALGEPSDGEASEKTLDALCDVTAMDIPQSLYDVFDKPIRFGEVIEADGIIPFIERKYIDHNN